MNTSPKTQQQQQDNQLLNCQKAVGKPEQLICTIQPVTPTEPNPLDPTIFLQYASSLAAIIQGVTLLVVALTKFSRVFGHLIRSKARQQDEPACSTKR